MKKKTIFAVILGLILLFGITLFSNYKNRDQTDIIREEDFEATEKVKTNTLFEYSDSEVKSFAKAVDEKREFEINDVDLQFGEDYYYVKQIKEFGSEDDLKRYRENVLSGAIVKISYGNNYEEKIIKPIYNINNIFIYDFVNEDLSLKNPEVFMGYIYNLREYQNTEDWINWNYNSGYRLISAEELYNQWVDDILRLNNDNSITTEDLNNIIFEHEKTVMSNFEIFKYDKNANIENLNNFYGDTLLKGIDYNNSKKYKINRLFQYFNLHPNATSHFLGNIFDTTFTTNNNYPLFPEEDNLIGGDNENYIINYYPEKVEMVNTTLIVTLKIDNPITDVIQLDRIKQNISHYFKNNNLSSTDNIDFDLILKFDYNNLTYDTFDEFDSFSIFKEGTKFKESGEDRYIDVVAIYNRAPWYPNLQNQKIIKSFFEKFKNFYYDDQEFSIESLFEDVAKEYNFEYIYIKNVITNYLWLIWAN